MYELSMLQLFLFLFDFYVLICGNGMMSAIILYRLFWFIFFKIKIYEV